jgi:uncharacterized protein (TIGR02246 family)
MADTPETAVRDLYRRLLEAWNGHDVEAFAGLFARDGVSIGFDGSQAQGPEIREHIGAVFSDHRIASYVAKVLDVRRLGDECGLLRSMVGMIPPGRDQLNPDVNALQCLLAERENGAWRVVLFQNTPAEHHGRPDLVDAHTAALEDLRASGETID